MSILRRQADGLTLKTYTWDVVDSQSYLLSCSGHGLLIDAVDSPALYRDISSLETLTLILTHSHFDHICGLNRIRTIFPSVRVVSTGQCSENLGNPYRNMSSSAVAYLSFYQGAGSKNAVVEPFVCEPADMTFDQSIDLDWNGRMVHLQACYGHSNDGLLALLDDKWLFSGDTLLPVPTITRFKGGSAKRFFGEDIPYLASLKDKVEMVFPGHGIPSFLDRLLAVNGKTGDEA